jgi:DNA uptake protein ComE-like DNA-binding protein
MFVCILLLTALLLLQSAADMQEWPVTVTYRYPAITSAGFEAEPALGKQEEPDLLPVFPLNLNTATREELMAVPRIGEVLSGRIVQYRDVLGGYTDLTQLTQIKGISENTLLEIGAYLTIE